MHLIELILAYIVVIIIKKKKKQEKIPHKDKYKKKRIKQGFTKFVHILNV